MKLVQLSCDVRDRAEVQTKIYVIVFCCLFPVCSHGAEMSQPLFLYGDVNA